MTTFYILYLYKMSYFTTNCYKTKQKDNATFYLKYFNILMENIWNSLHILFVQNNATYTYLHFPYSIKWWIQFCVKPPIAVCLGETGWGVTVPLVCPASQWDNSSSVPRARRRPRYHQGDQTSSTDWLKWDFE